MEYLLGTEGTNAEGLVCSTWRSSSDSDDKEGGKMSNTDKHPRLYSPRKPIFEELVVTHQSCLQKSIF